MNFDELKGLVELADCDLEEVLDGLVHTHKSQEASAINNGGTDEQLSYLVERMDKTDILENLGIDVEKLSSAGLKVDC